MVLSCRTRVVLLFFVISLIILDVTESGKDKDKKVTKKKEVYVMKKTGCGCHEKITLKKVGYVKEKKKKKKKDEDDDAWFYNDDDDRRRRRRRSIVSSSHHFSSSDIIPPADFKE